MHFLMDVFLKHRKIGLTEAFYRIIKPLHLQESDIKTVFVCELTNSGQHVRVDPIFNDVIRDFGKLAKVI